MKRILLAAYGLLMQALGLIVGSMLKNLGRTLLISLLLYLSGLPVTEAYQHALDILT